MDWDGHSRAVAAKVLELLCEGLGTEPKRLEELSCVEGRHMVCHYYPYCPQPHLTMGLSGHTDPGLLTVLIQNEVVPGLQVKKDGLGWVDVDPIPGGIIINVGDTFQVRFLHSIYVEIKGWDHRLTLRQTLVISDG